MRRVIAGCLCWLAGVLQYNAAFAAQSCGGVPGWMSTEISGSVRHPAAYHHHEGDWSLLLNPMEFGWRIEMATGTGAALPVFAAPIHPVDINPVHIAGWHFRNRNNTGPNTGDVNAPQRQRRFAFGALANEGGPNEAGGLGELSLDSFVLTPTQAGNKARMTSLTFTACIVWHAPSGKLAPLVSADPGVAYETAVSTILGCGFDKETYQLSDRMVQGREDGQRPYLEPDLDGDNIPDIVIPVIRKADDSPGLVMCLLGDERLIMAGYEGRIGAHLDPAYFGRADFWQVHEGPVGHGVGEGPPPRLSGDAILLAKQDSSSVLLFLSSSGNLDSYWQGD